MRFLTLFLVAIVGLFVISIGAYEYSENSPKETLNQVVEEDIPIENDPELEQWYAEQLAQLDLKH